MKSCEVLVNSARRTQSQPSNQEAEIEVTGNTEDVLHVAGQDTGKVAWEERRTVTPS
jgi:hypothetical protein